MTERFQLQAKCLTQNRCSWNPKPSRGLPNRPGPPGSPPSPPFWAHLTASLALDTPCLSVTSAAHQSAMPLISSLTLPHATLPRSFLHLRPMAPPRPSTGAPWGPHSQLLPHLSRAPLCCWRRLPSSKVRMLSPRPGSRERLGGQSGLPRLLDSEPLLSPGCSHGGA